MSDEQTRETARKDAARVLRNVTPSMADAMTELDQSAPDVLRAIVAGVNAMTDDSDVAAYAVTIAPRMWLDRRNDAPLTAVVAGAVRKASRVVALAGWDVYGDLTDADALGAGDPDDARTTLAHWGTAPADAQYGVTVGDVITTALGALPDGDRLTLTGAADAYLTAQRDRSGVGRGVSLNGALAWREGWTADDSAYHAARRMTVSAVKRVSRSYALSWGAPGERPSYGTNRVSVGNGFPRHDAPTGVIPSRDGRQVPGVTVRREYGVTVGREWFGPWRGAGRVSVWDRASASIVTVPVGFPLAGMTPSAMGSLMDWHALGGAGDVCDALGYPLGLGYAPSPDPACGFRAVREWRVSETALPPVTVGARRAMLPPSVVTTRTALGYDVALGYDAPLTARPLTDDETGTAGKPDARRVPIVPSGDAPDARPDDAPLTGRVGANGQVLSGKVPVSPRKRSGGNTGPTVPARLTR